MEIDHKALKDNGYQQTGLHYAVGPTYDLQSAFENQMTVPCKKMICLLKATVEVMDL